MDKAERAKLKQMAVDAIVKFDYDDPVVPFAEALEKVLDAMEEKPHCATCTCSERWPQ